MKELAGGCHCHSAAFHVRANPSISGKTPPASENAVLLGSAANRSRRILFYSFTFRTTKRVVAAHDARRDRARQDAHPRDNDPSTCLAPLNNRRDANGDGQSLRRGAGDNGCASPGVFYGFSPSLQKGSPS